MALQPVRLADVLQRHRSLVLERSDVRIHLDVPAELTVLADPVELDRVLSNLLENAARYGKSADSGVAEVDIRAKAQDGWALLDVRDQGPGVAPSQLAHLTKAFFRGDAARTSATGAGLGLAIVEKNVQRMGGVLRLSNRPSGGLAVRIQLRLA